MSSSPIPIYSYHARGELPAAPTGYELLGQMEHVSQPVPAGTAAPRDVPRFVVVMPELHQPQRAIQSWWARGPLKHTASHRVGGATLQWAEAPDCALLVAEADPELSVRAQSRQLYLAVLSTLRQLEKPHPLRIWNYVARINEPEDGDDTGTGEANGTGQERYRLFNSGRRDALRELDFGMSEGAPAACALGKCEGPLQVAVLSHRHAPVAIENPRQVNAYDYPTQYGADAPVFSRAAWMPAATEGEGMLLISGTSSIVSHETLHAGNVREQTRETLRNLQALLDVAEHKGAPALPLQSLEGRVYIRHASDAAAVREVLQAAGVERLHYVQADVCRADLLVEIEAEVQLH